MDKNSTVLLESGTNELEIVEFEVNGNKYGINVIKSERNYIAGSRHVYTSFTSSC